MSEINWTNWLILMASIVVLIGMGYYTNKKIVHGSDGEGGFLLAGRSLGPIIGGGTIVATGFSGWGFMGSPGAAYAFGTTELLGNFFFGFSLVIGVLFFARFLYRRGVKMGALTIPEFIAKNHPGDERMQRILQGTASIITAVLLSVFLVGQIKALGMLGGSWLGIPLEYAAALMVLVIVIYTSMGGLAAVAWTDTFMVICMTISAIYICFQMFTDISLFEMIEQLNVIDANLVNPATANPYGSAPFQIFYLLPYTILFACVLPYQSIRLMSFRPDVKAHHAAMVVAPIGLMLSMIPFVGLYMRIKFPELAVADEAMPLYLKHFMPPIASGLITLFILFAMQSTANSVLLVVSSSLSHDLRKAIKPDSKISDKQAITLNQTMVVIIGLITMAMMLFAPPFMLNMIAIMGTGTLMASFVGPVLVSVFWKGTAKGALAAILTGFCISGGLLIFSNLGWIEPPIYAAVCSSIIYVVVSRFTRTDPVRSKETTQASHSHNARPLAH